MAKPQERIRAIELREHGWSVTDIARETGVARSTVWLWVRHLPFDPGSERARRRRAEGRAAVRTHWAVRRRAAATDRAATLAAAAQLVGPLSPRELSLVGAAIYWCEGSKSKPWRPQERVIFTNSDPDLIRLFLAFLHGMEVPPQSIGFRLYIHETTDVAAAESWWADRLCLPVGRLSRTSLKRHTTVPKRRNLAEDYHGCLAVSVRGGRELYRRIEGLVQGIVEGVATRDAAARPVRYSLS
jgi:Homeodomain-like domain